VLLGLTLTGCAQVIGIDEFTLTGGSGGTGEPVDVCNDVHGCKREAVYSFGDLPIEGGVLPTPDPNSPIKNPSMPTDMTASFTLGSACSYPYFSEEYAHTGVIFIQ
jgi:hypothetical protein